MNETQSFKNVIKSKKYVLMHTFFFLSKFK